MRGQVPFPRTYEESFLKRENKLSKCKIYEKYSTFLFYAAYEKKHFKKNRKKEWLLLETIPFLLL